MARREVDLGSAELEVLKALWDGGAGTVRDVRSRLTAHGRSWAYTTVQTFLTRLEQKGHVVSDKSGLAHVFRARITRERVSRSRLRRLVDQLYDGAAGPLVLQLVRDRRLSRDDLARLQALIDTLDSNGGRRTKHRSRRA